jgi:hypothetical protein
VADRKPAPPIITEEHWQAILQAAAPLSAAADVERARREMEEIVSANSMSCANRPNSY